MISRPLFKAVLPDEGGALTRIMGCRRRVPELLEMHPTLNSNVLKALRGGA